MICNECKSKFGQAKEISAEEFYGVSDLFDYSCGEKIKVCPNCENNDIEVNDDFGGRYEIRRRNVCQN